MTAEITIQIPLPCFLVYLTMPSQLNRFYSVEGNVFSYDSGMMWNEAVVAYFKLLSEHFVDERRYTTANLSG